MNRRTFLETSVAGLAYSSIAATAADIAKGPTKRVALIGTGWYGKVDLLRLIQVAPVEVVALCDVDSAMLSGAAEIVAKRQKSGKRPKTYGDYRTLLKENKLDLVLIGTPDHWHALPMIAAVKAGCDVYVQKPTSIDVVESQAMLAAARKYNRVVQVGTQRRSTRRPCRMRHPFRTTVRTARAAYHRRRRMPRPPRSSTSESLWRPSCRLRWKSCSWGCRSAPKRLQLRRSRSMMARSGR